MKWWERLLVLAIFAAVMVGLGYLARWMVDDVLPMEVVALVAGFALGVGAGMLIMRHEYRARERLRAAIAAASQPDLLPPDR